MVKRISLLFLAAVLLVAACAKPEKVPQAGVFELSGLSSFSAEAQSVSVAVNCDIAWKAAFSETVSWASMTQTGSEIVLSLGFNREDKARTLSLTVTAGKEEKTFSITQEGITSVVKPLSLQISGTDAGRLDIRLKQDWDAVCEASWISLEREQGSGGITRLKVIPADGNENVGERRAELVIKTAGETITVPVAQGQTDVVCPSDKILGANAAGGNRSYEVATNVDFSVEVPSTAGWLSCVEVKSLNSSKLVLHFDENRSGKTREAVITLKYGSESKSLTVRQMYKHAMLEKGAPGVYGLLDEDCAYSAGSDQWSWMDGPEGSSFRILSPADRRVLAVSGLPAGVQYGDSFTVSISRKDGIFDRGGTDAKVTVVDMENGFVRLDAGTGKGLVLKKEDL